MSKKKILITGSNGFIGSRLVKRLSRNTDFEIHSCNVPLEDQKALRKVISKESWDCVIHLAAISFVPACEKDPELAFKVNADATKNLANLLVEFSTKAHFIFPSTAYVYKRPEENKNEEIKISEDFGLGPTNIYGETKLKAEEYLSEISKNSDLRISIFRLFNHTHHTQDKSFFLPNMHDQFLKMLKSGENILKVGNVEVSRDFGSIVDLIDLLELVVSNSELFPRFDQYNVSSGVAKNLKEVLNKLATEIGISNMKLEVDPSRVRAGEPKVVTGDCSKISQFLNWKPKCDSVENLIKAFLQEV